MKKKGILSILSILAITFTLQAAQSENLVEKNIIKQVPIYNNAGDLVSNTVYIETVVDGIMPAKSSKVSKSSQSVTVNITAGGLVTALTPTELKSVTSLIIKGSIDARDFKTMKDSMTYLSDIDFSEARIEEYYGNKGTYDTINTLYPANVIPPYAFGSKGYLNGNNVLQSVKMSSTTISIGDYAFQYCSKLTSINIPSSVIAIGKSAFFDCPRLPSILIPSSVTSIGERAFLGDYCLIDVEAENTAFSSIDGILFDKPQTTLIKYPLSKIGAYVIPSTVNSIYNLAFFGCNDLTEVTIPSTVTSLGSQAFSFCKGLNSIFIPSTVTTMGSSAFLSSSCFITVDENNTNFSSSDGLLFNKTKTALIQCPTSISGIYNIPTSVTTFGSMAFHSCAYLTAITIPSSISNIPYSVFNNCTGLTSLTIPASVINIGGSALYNCSNLTSLYVLSPNPVNLSASANVFFNINKSTCKLYVLIGSKSSYQAATQWKDFMNIEEMTTGILPIGQSNIKILLKDKTLGITNAELGSKIKIYTVTGTTIKEQRVENTQTNITLPTGVYILRIGDYSGKVIIE